MFWPLLIAFFVIALAELGDKTQLLTFALVTRYSRTQVLGAVFVATATLMALAVTFGDLINTYVPAFQLQLLAGLLFIFFGLKIILGKDKDQEQGKEQDNKNSFLVIFLVFFLAELGDKTQLATFALAAKYGAPVQVWLGATLGMFLVNVLAAFFGAWIKQVVPEKTIKILSASVFLVFGILTIVKLYI